MKANHVIILTALLAVVMTSCKSNKRVIRPDYSDVVVTAPSGNTSSSDKPRPTKNSNDPQMSGAVVEEAYSWIGTPYKYGGETKKGADCSGMIMAIFRDVAGLKLPRNSAAQHDYCVRISRRELEPGDLVFFTGAKGMGNISHVGLYVGKGRMIHSSSSRGVIVSDLSEKYYDKHYSSSGRVYGITYAATGRKPNKNSDRPALPEPVYAKDRGHKPAREMTLEEFMAMNRRNARPADSVRNVIEIPLDSISSIGRHTDADTVVTHADSVPTPDKVVERADTVRPVSPSADGSVVIIEGRRVESRPHRPAPEAPADTAKSSAIRSEVSRAMKFGK